MSSSYSGTAVEIPPRLLLEWLDGNQHRAYPLDESTAGGNARIPYPLFVDALFSITSNIDRTSLYISKLVVGDISLRVFLSGSVNGVDTELGAFADIYLDPAATPSGTEVPISVTGDTYTVSGTLVIGNIQSASELPATLTLTPAAGLIFPGCVRTYNTLTGLSVNGELYTGTVTLEAGDGIEFDYDSSTNTLKISSTNYEIPEENTYIVSDETLLREAINIFGDPVRSINGQFPYNGNINIVDPPLSSGSAGQDSSGNSYVSVEQVGLGAISITLTNDNTVTTCNDDIIVTVDSLMSSVANLNDRIASIDTAVSALDKASSNLAIQLSRY